PLSYFYFHYSRHHRDLPSFPTRRSSDLFGCGGQTQHDLPRRRLLLRRLRRQQRPTIRHGPVEHRTCPFRRPAPLGAVSQRERHRSEEHTSELQSPCNLVCRLLLEKKKKK